jgi:hypothetical protein
LWSLLTGLCGVAEIGKGWFRVMIVGGGLMEACLGLKKMVDSWPVWCGLLDLALQVGLTKGARCGYGL